MTLKKPSLIVQIFLGMFFGIIVGYFWKDFAPQLHLLSDIFMRLIKMIIAPLVFSVLVVGVAKVGDFKSVGRIGLKTILYFTAAAIISLLLGLMIVNFAAPGKTMHLELPATTAETGIEAAKSFDAKNFIEHVIPASIVEVMAKNEILPIVIFALFFGVACASIGNKGKVVVEFFDSVSHIMFKVTNYVMAFAPFGVFGALAAVVAKQGLGVLAGYVYLIGTFYLGLILFVFVILFLICFFMKIKFFQLLGYIKEPILLAFSTASSEAAMPKTIESLERFGCGNRIISFVLPLGYSFNLDGSMMYMTFATVFIAQAYGIEMTTGDQITMLLILLITSKGMAGIPRASLVVIAGMLDHFHIPVAGLLLLLGIDQILDMGRSATNVVGNAVATAVISKWEGELGPPRSDNIDKVRLD
ncbi:MAG: dicarboxylate/amino acid:cation symporter [Bacteroidetes bacterium]|jgi:Na+/H+-dicarboxylate symporter|nr:dicarboxylate/amino acid:cation symporter [Bacteroidota bacterium]